MLERLEKERLRRLEMERAERKQADAEEERRLLQQREEEQRQREEEQRLQQQQRAEEERKQKEEEERRLQQQQQIEEVQRRQQEEQRLQQQRAEEEERKQREEEEKRLQQQRAEEEEERRQQEEQQRLQQQQRAEEEEQRRQQEEKRLQQQRAEEEEQKQREEEEQRLQQQRAEEEERKQREEEQQRLQQQRAEEEEQRRQQEEQRLQQQQRAEEEEQRRQQEEQRLQQQRAEEEERKQREEEQQRLQQQRAEEEEQRRQQEEQRLQQQQQQQQQQQREAAEAKSEKKAEADILVVHADEAPAAPWHAVEDEVGDDGEEDAKLEEARYKLKAATLWHMGGVQASVQLEVLPPNTTAAQLGLQPSQWFCLDPSIAVDVSVCAWHDGSRKLPPGSARHMRAAAETASVHDWRTYERGVLRLVVHTTDGFDGADAVFTVGVEALLFATPVCSRGDQWQSARQPLPQSAKLPYPILLARLLEGCYFNPPLAAASPRWHTGGGAAAATGSGSGSGGAAQHALLVDTQFVAAEASEPDSRNRPIMCHTRKFGSDIVIVSLHAANDRPGSGKLGGSKPKFLLQAFNYTTKEYLAQDMSQEELLMSEKPFLQQAAQVYFASNANRPSTQSSLRAVNE